MCRNYLDCIPASLGGTLANGARGRFILREAFALLHEEIANTLGISPVGAALIPLVSMNRACTVLLHPLRRSQPLTYKWCYINDVYELILYQGEVLHSATMAEVKSGKISRLFTTGNPDS